MISIRGVIQGALSTFKSKFRPPPKKLIYSFELNIVHFVILLLLTALLYRFL